MQYYFFIIPFFSQTSPESRPTLEQILQHSFFTKPGSFIPDQLPECALRVPPLFQNAQLSEGVENRKGGGGGGGGGSKFDNEVILRMFVDVS